MRTLILIGSARGDGNTARVARRLARDLEADLVDLLTLRIAPFRYDQRYPPEDDFLTFVENRLLDYDRIVFASPVYWYSMSGGMKIFFDRMSDLLKSRKDLGRRLRGKTMAVLSCANDEDVNVGFHEPFRLSAAYLGMQYGPLCTVGWIQSEEPLSSTSWLRDIKVNCPPDMSGGQLRILILQLFLKRR